MSGISVTFTGSAEVKAIFDAMPGKVQKKLIRHALRAAAKAIQEDAKRIAPDETGALAKSIKVRAMKRSRTRVGVQVFTDSDSLQTDGKKGYYAAFTELGTSREAAQPFLRPALEGNKGQAQSMIASDIKDAVESQGEE